MTTYKRADRDLIYGEYGWVTDLDYFDDADDPIELVEEVWERRSTRRIVKLPNAYSCAVEDEEPCEEDADAWWLTDDGVWLSVCPAHLAALPDTAVTGESCAVVSIPLGPVEPT